MVLADNDIYNIYYDFYPEQYLDLDFNYIYSLFIIRRNILDGTYPEVSRY